MWTYSQMSGELRQDGKLIANGYSGRDHGKNRPEMQDIPNTGPIPRGRYTIGPPYNSPKRGPLCLPLVPHAGNQMFGRSAFLVHGDSIREPGSASEGCIIMPRTVRERMAASMDKTLEVTE